MLVTLKLFVRLLPKAWAADMQAESRSWMMRCPACGFERSVWEAEGIRWKASGNPRRLMRCTQCGQTTWHTTTKATP